MSEGKGLTRFLEAAQIALNRAVQDLLCYGTCLTHLSVDASGNPRVQHVEITRGSTDG